MPLEEHVLWSAEVAKRYLEAGCTSCVGAACAKPRLDVVTRNAINAGQIPGPRYLAASQEITVAGGLGDEMLPHLPFPEFSFGVVVSGPEEMRKAVRMFLKYGVDSIKLNLSGDNFAPTAPAEHDLDERRGGRGRDATRCKMRGKRGVAPRALARVGQAVRAPRHRHHLPRELHRRGSARPAGGQRRTGSSSRPASRILSPCSTTRSPGASPHEGDRRWATRSSSAAAIESLQKMHKRGIRVLPGGDYGFAWTPHGENAKDLEYFVKYLGMTPMEAIVSATRLGGEIMMQGGELGQIKDGYLADLLLVDGDPLANLGILRDPKQHPRGHEGRRVLQGARDRRRARAQSVAR